ncbi:MAG: sulfatase-like hydrolase/transferase, partial [bacterium]
MQNDNHTSQTRRRFIRNAGMAGAALTAFSNTAGAANKSSAGRPNLIVFLTDDQRWDSIGGMGNSIIHTPVLDRLVSEGVSFTNNFCTTSICMTSRATIFTGLYSRCHTINDFQKPLPESLFAMTYPMLLRDAGYRTGFVGKWGLGGDLPVKRFDFFEGFSGQGQYFHEIHGESMHLTRLMAQNAMRFVRDCSSDQPFCLSVSFKAPHVKDGDPNPFQYDPDFEELYQGIDIPAPKTAALEYFNKLPEFIRESEGRVRWETRFSSPE